jgi:hypothetical protein
MGDPGVMMYNGGRPCDRPRVCGGQPALTVRTR